MIYLLLFVEFFKIGLFTIGGGYAMIPLVLETSLKHNWMSEDSFESFLGVCESTPGPIAINMATYIGSTNGGILGSVVATLGVVLPSVIIIILIASILKNLTKNKCFKGAINGIKPVVIALIFSTGVILIAKQIGYVNTSSFIFDYKSLIILSIIAAGYITYQKTMKKKPNTIIVIILSACLGMIFSII